jgi:hypothetical protein
VDDLTKKRFLWGVALAWVPWIPILIGLVNAFVSIANTKATGLTASAAGLIEMLITWGVFAMLISQVAAIVLLFRTFARGHWVRGLLSAVSICLSGVMIILICLSLWLLRFQSHHRF